MGFHCHHHALIHQTDYTYVIFCDYLLRMPENVITYLHVLLNVYRVSAGVKSPFSVRHNAFLRFAFSSNFIILKRRILIF